MKRCKIIFNQTLMISTGILFGLGIQELIRWLAGGITEIRWPWYIPLTIIFTGLLCSLASLFLVGVCATGLYMINDYNTKSFSKDYTPQERLERNTQINAWVARENPDETEEDLVTVIQSARSKAFNPQMTYEFLVYRLDWEQFHAKEGSTVVISKKDTVYSLDVVRGYSKSYAAKDDALTLIGSGSAVADKHTGECLSINVQWMNSDAQGEKTP